jgi:soluble lytic murein transglycosylase
LNGSNRNLREPRSAKWPWSAPFCALAIVFCLQVLLSCGVFARSTPPQTQTRGQRRSRHANSKPVPRARPPQVIATGAAQELERLAHELHDRPTETAYERLSQFATGAAGTALGARAALALGYYDYTRNHFPEARKWLERAAADPLLADYALYWEAQDDRAAGAIDIALAELKRYRERYPDSAMSDAAVEALAQVALAAGRPDETALESYPKTSAKASLVLLRAQAREKTAIAKGQKPTAAAGDYLDVIYRFPLNEEATIALERIPYLQLTLGEQFPGTPVQTEVARAEVLYDARRWRDVRKAYEELLPKLSGTARERASLRVAEAQVQLDGSPQALMSIALTDPELDAERIYTLSQVKRSANVETEMFTSIERLVSAYPRSLWAEQALFAAGNFYWASLDREHAVEYYQRLVSTFPAGRFASVAQWRIAWTAYLSRQPDVQTRLEQFLKQYPASTYAVDALYWLGRSSERSGNSPHARTFYLAAVQRFPQTYFGQRAAQRLREIGQEPINPAEFLSVISPAPALQQINGPLPAAAAERWSRAQALRSIAFDSSAEMELRAAYSDTHAPSLLLAAAQAAIGAGHYAEGIITVRQLVPELEARRFEELPDEAWRTAFPLAYGDALRREAQRNHLDPMLVAGLIRQESAFTKDAVSRSDAVGLMQLLPTTGKQLAQRLGVGFARARLFDPEYNLRLGALYLSGLLEQYRTPEAALAAYNAGENRVAEWTTGQNYEETAEFVESIPFTETRDYVQIVSRNAELYRQIYGRSSPPVTKSSGGSGR